MQKEKEKVLVACSGGPDSMALLDMARNQYEVYVAHVNYHKRRSANRDERIVKNYCEQFQLPFMKKDFSNKKSSGNFQDQARVFRYQFFAETAKEKGISKVLVAHHQDDLIETYLLQQKRKGQVDYYGLKKENIILGIKVVRPLLKYSKQALLKYCLDNKIAFGIDESNLTDHYTRNQIRHQIVEKLSVDQRKTILKEIKEKNRIQQQSIKDAKKYLNKRSRISVSEFLAYANPEQLLNVLLKEKISTKQNREIIKEISQGHKFELLIGDSYLCHEYDYLECYPKEVEYCYHFDSLKTFKAKHFKLSKRGNSKQAVTINEDDFPLMVRNFQAGDYIAMRYGSKKINRFFIDNKISSKKRKTWPIMVNKNGSAILVPEIGCDRYHYSQKPNWYMVEL